MSGGDIATDSTPPSTGKAWGGMGGGGGGAGKGGRRGEEGGEGRREEGGEGRREEGREGKDSATTQLFSWRPNNEDAAIVDFE